MKVHFASKLVAVLLLLTARVNGQCNNAAGCFPAIGNIALFRNITATSTCGENGITQFGTFFDDGSGGGSGLMDCSASDPSLAYPASSINDNNPATSWQSDTYATNVTVQLDLEGPMLFESLRIVWNTPRPTAMIIERSADFGSNWTAYRFFATNCQNFAMLNHTTITPGTTFPSTDPVCTIMDSNFTPPMDSEITFNASSHFHSEITDNEKLEYQTVTNLRLSLLGTHGMGVESYYGISEWYVYGSCSCSGHADQCIPLPGETGSLNKVFAGCDCQHHTAGNNCEMCEPLYNNAEYMRGTNDSANVCQRCQCYGHADECVYNSTINEGQCVCDNYTEGIMCEDCVAGFYRDNAMLLTEPCVDCGCFMPGVSDAMICNSSTGMCFCKKYVDSNINTYCDTCLDEYWNISGANPDGCQECSCSMPGSSSQICDKTYGNCTCNDNYLPPFCTNCMDGFFQLGSACEACGCNPVGALNSSCTQPDGQCYCRENITSTRCNAPATGFYARPLDFFVFEAEDAIYPDGTNKIFPAVSNPTNFTGQGFLELTMLSTDIIFQFSVSVSYQYGLIIRYSTMTEGFVVRVVVESLSGVGTNSSDISTSLDITVMPTHGAKDVSAVYLEADEMYEAHLTFFNFNFGITTRRLLLDSIVLMPRFVDGSEYLNSPEALPVHNEIVQFCIPTVFGPVSPICDPDLIFILSVEFFGQVYSCGCNPVGTEVADDCSISSGTCTCKQGIGGTLCDRCISSYFNFTTNGCSACNCFMPGVVDFTHCDPVNGTCMCKANVDSEVNRICDTCLDGYWNISSDNPDGCQACQCNPNGSSDSVCDKMLGNCSCYANFIGRTCSECADGYYFSDNQCIPCDCHPVGSNHGVCNKTSGQCDCKPNIEGRRCNEAQPGHFFRALDYIRFEAEDLSYSEEFSEVFPITTNPVYENSFTGRGYIAYPVTTGELNFILTVPRSSQYELILRHRLSETMIFFVNITSLTSTVNSLDCYEVNNTATYFNALSLTSQDSFTVLYVACLDEGTEYEMTVQQMFTTLSTIFEVDSIVALPYFKNVSNYYNYSSALVDSCLPRAAGSVPPGNTICDEIAFSLSVEYFGQVFECDCDVTGTNTMQERSCECNGGYCSCKDGVGGERCDQCLNGYYNFSTTGCTACGCDVNNSISLLCDDGQCPCVLGIAGPRCNRCEGGWYNFTSSGCRSCNCELLGSESNICDELTGACTCIGRAMGDLCSTCPVGTILTNTSYQRFCEPCRCYNHSDMCTAETNTFNLAAITSNFIELCNNNNYTINDDGWELEGNGTFTRCSENGLGYNSSITDMDRLVAPNNFTGELTGSYSLRLVVELQLSQITSISANISTVEICGPGGIECLVGIFELDSSKLQSNRIILLSIPFRETYWWFKNNPGSQPTYLEFLYTLTDVTSISFSASYAMVETYYLQSISLQTVISINAVLRSDVMVIEAMFPVEYCQQCSINYTGRFCENCAEGFYRLPGGLDCIACNCNDLSQSCDPQTGACTNCTENTTGENCESCIPGFYGDPGRSIPCRPCECGEVTDPTCELDIDANQTCNICPVGRTGRNCELCDDDYFRVGEDVCFRCQCFGNAMPSDGESICDMENGFCNDCSFNTTGRQCELCLPGFFGDPTGDAKCSECTCHVNGTDGVCTNVRAVGVCTCKSGTIGSNCDTCLPGYWGLHLGGCRPCNCCTNGSLDGSCDQITGRCFCLPGVGSENDEKCCDCSLGYYNFESGTGCQDCGCSEAVLSPQCNENGTCMCTEGAIGEKCDECGFEYSGEVPNCQRCPVCFDSGLEIINELSANITALMLRLDQFYSARAPLDDINDIISELDYQLTQAEYAILNMMINRSDVTLIENKANSIKTLLVMFRQNITIASDLLTSINASVTHDLDVIVMFDGTVNGTTVADEHTRLDNFSLTVSNLNVSSHEFFRALHQTLVEANNLQNDFDIVRNNITESLMYINETIQMLSAADNLIDSTMEQNLDNRDSLSLLCAEIPVLQNDLRDQLSRVQRYRAQLNSTYLNALTLQDSLIQSEQEILMSSTVIDQIYNYSNISLDLITNAVVALQDLNENTNSLANRTQRLLDNMLIQQDIIFNVTGVACMANSTIWETLGVRTPDIELAQMLARDINSTYVPDEEVTIFTTAVSNSTLVAQQTLQIARNASELVDQISVLVNDTLDKINSSELLHDHVNATLQQLLRQQRDIHYYASQVTGNLMSLNSSAETIVNLIDLIDMAITNAYATGIDNYNKSEALRNNATELCTLANSLEQQSNELNMSLTNISSEIGIAEQNSTTQFTTLQTLHNYTTALNTNARQVTIQQLQDLLNEYLADRDRIQALTATANSLNTELNLLITDIENTSAILRDCVRTP